MARRPIIDIQLNTQAWDDFRKSYAEHEAAVEKAPEEWQAVSDAIDEAAAAGEGLNGINETMGRIGENANNLVTYTGETVVRQEGLERATRKTLTTTERLSKVSKEVASAFVTAAKWMTIGGGVASLATGAGLFGLDRMADGVYRDRRAAQGLSLDMATVDAFKQNFDPFVDSESLLSRVANMRNDVGKQWVFRSVGLTGNEVAHENNADVSADVVRNVRQMIQGVPDQMLSAFAKARGIDQLFSMDELRRLRDTPESSLDRAQGDFYYDRRRFTIPEAEQVAWVKFSRSLTEAGILIDRSLIRGLAPLAGPLTSLSHAVADLITSFLGGVAVNRAMEKLAGWLGSEKIRDAVERLGEYLGSPQFLDDIKRFVAAIGAFFHGAINFFEHPLRTLFGWGSDSGGDDAGGGGTDKDKASGWGGWHLPGGKPAGGGLLDWLHSTFGIGTAHASELPQAGDDRIAAIRDQLAHDLGLTTAQAGGFLAAPYAESGLHGVEQTYGLQPGQPPDLGWAQWHGPRRAEFLKWAAEHGLDWHSDAANMGFMEHELQTPQYAALLAQLRQAQSGTDAAALGHQYESGKSDYFRAQHMAQGERFAHLPPHVPHTSATTPAPVKPTALEDTLHSIRKHLASAAQWGNGRVQVSVSNQAAARVAVIANGAAA